VLAEHLDGGTDAPRVMIRDGNLKLVLSRAYPPMLHDLGQDPRELRDIAKDPSAKADLQRLTSRAEEIWDLDSLAEEKRASQTARSVVNAALHQGRRQPWDFVPGALVQNTGYVRSGDTFPEVDRRGYLRSEGTGS
jgi:choline-sulfatase